MSEAVVYDFDAAVGEVEEAWWVFKFHGQEFKANLNVDGAVILKWMRNARSMEAIPILLEAVLGEDEYKRLLGTGAPWKKYEALVLQIMERLGGSGNVPLPV